jgi:hypothetical protein
VIRSPLHAEVLPPDPLLSGPAQTPRLPLGQTIDVHPILPLVDPHPEVTHPVSVGIRSGHSTHSAVALASTILCAVEVTEPVADDPVGVLADDSHVSHLLSRDLIHEHHLLPHSLLLS